MPVFVRDSPPVLIADMPVPERCMSIIVLKDSQALEIVCALLRAECYRSELASLR